MDVLEVFLPDSLICIQPAGCYDIPKLPECSYSERMFRLKCMLTLNNTCNGSTFFRYFPFLAWSLPLLLPTTIFPPRLFSSTSLTMGEKSKNLEVFNPIYFPSQAIISSYLQKEFDPVSELREEDKPEEKIKSKEEEAEEDSENEEQEVAQERVRRTQKEKCVTVLSTVVVDMEDWEAMRRAVVAASARSAFREGIVIYPDGYWSEGLPSDSSLHEWDCLCTQCGDPESDDDDTSFLLNTWHERKTL